MQNKEGIYNAYKMISEIAIKLETTKNKWSLKENLEYIENAYAQMNSYNL